jgi:hypothetical protein
VLASQLPSSLPGVTLDSARASRTCVRWQDPAVIGTNFYSRDTFISRYATDARMSVVGRSAIAGDQSAPPRLESSQTAWHAPPVWRG